MQSTEDLRRENELFRMQKMDADSLLQNARQDLHVAQTINNRLQQDLAVLSECVLCLDDVCARLTLCGRSQRRSHSIF